MCPNIWIYVLGGDSLRILYWPSLKDLSMNGDRNDDSPVNSHESKRSFLRESFFIIFWSQVTNSRRMFWVRQYNMLLFIQIVTTVQNLPAHADTTSVVKASKLMMCGDIPVRNMFHQSKNVLILTTILLELNSAR